ncbi:MAG: GIY-YIG nuclease family protein [bacterium]|nr:GIY-YIG nuclease family protein [bacterium]
MTARKDLASKLRELPPSPGVYLFRDSQNRLLYVGKGKNLKNRVNSYFIKNDLKLGPKTSQLVDKIRDIRWVVTDTELEALLLEAELIKRSRPKYNLDLKDDKFYQQLLLTEEDLPTLKVVHRESKNERGELFGPFPQGKTVRQVYKILQKAFKFRTCGKGKLATHQKLNQPCLLFSLGLCTAPCAGNISSANYRQTLSHLRKFLKGGKPQVLGNLKRLMTKASKENNFEQAAFWRDQIASLEYVLQTWHEPAKFIENPNLASDIATARIQDLIAILRPYFPSLHSKPDFRIEAYDISNISGKNATASMIVFTDGQTHPNHYRRFRIKSPPQPNDVLMIKEAFRRRFTTTDRSSDESFALKPDLLVVDGGKPQVAAVAEILIELHLNLPLIGLAKREEEIVLLISSGFETLKLKRHQPGLQLLQAVRDEAHRFAKTYHKLLASKSLVK